MNSGVTTPIANHENGVVMSLKNATNVARVRAGEQVGALRTAASASADYPAPAE